MAAAANIKLGFVNAARRAATPHIVDCNGLSRTNLTKPSEFEHAFNERRAWCQKHAAGEFEIEPIGPNPEQLTGRRFRFESADTAALFKLWFQTDL